jgi:hypothetical protein
MEFLGINFTKDSTDSTLVLKIHTKKSTKQENSSLFVNSILYKGKMRVENQTKSEKTRVYAQKPRLKMPFKKSISVLRKKWELAEERRAAILLLSSVKFRRNCFPASTACSVRKEFIL